MKIDGKNEFHAKDAMPARTSQFQVNKQLTKRRPITRRNYRDQATLLLQACDWMQQLDVKVRPTRIGKYMKMLNLLADHHEQGKIDDLRAEYGDEVLLNTLSESDTVITRSTEKAVRSPKKGFFRLPRDCDSIASEIQRSPTPEWR